MTISVGRLIPGNQWDQNLLDRLFANQLHPTGLEFRRVEGYPNGVDGCILLVPGRYWHHRSNEISEYLSRYQWVLLIRTSDEEDLFDTPYRIVHNNIRHWVQTPRTDRDYGDARLFGCGYPPHFNILHQHDRDTDIFLSAQGKNERREQCFTAMRYIKGSKQVTETPGFTQGMPPDQYAQRMASAKVAPCPAGPKTPDTFRLWEALEAHTVPIADDITPAYDSAGYWGMVLPGAPFPVLTDYGSLNGYIQHAVDEWPANANRITAWWMRYKRQLTHWLLADLEALGAL